MDGYLSASMFYVYIKEINPNINIQPFFHHKHSKAHGLSDKDLFNQIKSCDPSLLIILDAGSDDKKECAKLRKLGFEILSADHHFFSEWNDECVLVNNHMSKNVINKGLCGTGVTWKCLKRYDELYGYDIANSLISYVAFANVSDSMSLVYQENRAFSKWGFKNIHKNLQPFFDEFVKDGIIVNESVVWNVTPKGNALIRLGELQDKIDFFYSLCGEYEQKDMIDRMKKCHSKQNNDKKKLLEDIEIIYNGTCVLSKVKVKTPLTGLVANMMASNYMKPILLVHDLENGQSAGSVRSKVPIKKFLTDSGMFDYNKGHEDYAFGTAYQTIKEQDIINYLDGLTCIQKPCMDVLLSNKINNIDSKLYSLKMDYNDLWSKGINKPLFHIQQFTIYNTDIILLGKNKTTLKFNNDGTDFIMFFVSNKNKEELHIGESKCKLNIECIVELDFNIWNNKKTKQAQIKHIEIISPQEESWEDLFG